MAVIHDGEAARRRLGKLFRLWGCRVEIEESARGAVRMLQSHCPDAVVCAEVLPTMDGAALRREVRQLPGRASLPFVFVASAATDDESAGFVISRRGARTLAERMVEKMNLAGPAATKAPSHAAPSGMWKNVLAARYADLDPDSELESASQAIILSI